jgi:hypothetical protein
LFHRHEDFRHRCGRGADVRRIGYHPDDLRGLRLLRLVAHADASADCCSSSEMPRYERFVDDDDGWRAGAIAFVEYPARTKADTDRIEVSAARERGLRDRKRRAARCRRAVDEHPVADEGLRRKLRGETCASHVGQRLDTTCELFEEGDNRFARLVLFLGQCQPHRDHSGGVDPGVYALQVEKAPKQQAGAQRQHHRERNLGDDETVASAAGSPAGRRQSRVLFERLIGIRTAGLKDRQQAHEKNRSRRR